MKLRSLLVIATLAALGFGACTKKTSSSPSHELLVGTDAAYAPFEVENPDKKITGFDIDILSAVALKAGLQVKFINTPWEGLFTQLENGDRDLLVSAITINETRKKQMDFSAPYFEAVQLIAVPATSKVKSIEDLKGLKVGVQSGTTGDEVVSKLLGKNNAGIKRFEGTPLALKELQNGGVEAVVADNGVIHNFLKNNPAEFKLVSDKSFSKEHYGIAVRKGNQELVDKINKALEAIRADGTYDRIYRQYFAETK